ncbi:MAG TPA: fused MFS/spermidine synthase [Actinomycetales bacterium]|nr:fused MFS/spermidine synthase [Actinomycetales bacterium]
MSRGRAPRGAPAARGPRPVAGTYEVDTGVVELVQEPSDPGLWTLWLNGVPSSPIHLGEPTILDFEYLRWMAAVLDVLPTGPIDAVHLGGAACALPRYVEATRPGSAQVVMELDGELARLVREWFDLPRSPRLRIQVGDARSRLMTRRDGSADVVVRDAFSGATTPRHLTTVQFVEDVRRVLRDEGVYLANVADRSPLPLLRAEVTALRQVFRHTAVVAETSMLKGRRYANAVLLGSRSPLPLRELTRRLAREPVTTRVVSGEALVALAAGAKAPEDPPFGRDGESTHGGEEGPAQ